MSADKQSSANWNAIGRPATAPFLRGSPREKGSHAQKGTQAAATDLAGLSATARKALMQFDDSRRLVHLPSKRSVLQMAMWARWARFPARRSCTEKQVNDLINAHHTFGDQATLRRELVGMKLIGRKAIAATTGKNPGDLRRTFKPVSAKRTP